MSMTATEILMRQREYQPKLGAAEAWLSKFSATLIIESAYLILLAILIEQARSVASSIPVSDGWRG